MQILVTNNKMKFAKENLNLEKGLNKEWVITNGLGGFASSTLQEQIQEDIMVY